MEFLQISPNVLSILGVLCTLSATMAFSAQSVRRMVAQQYYEERKLSVLNRLFSFIYGMYNLAQVSDVFLGGRFEERRRRTDSNSPGRGIVWVFFATFFFLAAIVSSTSPDHEFLTNRSILQIRLFPDLFIIIAIIWSLLYGFFAEKIFGNKKQREEASEEFGLLGHLHQFWLNFVGVAAGWLSFYLFIKIIRDLGVENLTSLHLMLLLIGVIGIVGWLPMTLAGISNALASTVARLIDKI